MKRVFLTKRCTKCLRRFFYPCGVPPDGWKCPYSLHTKKHKRCKGVLRDFPDYQYAECTEAENKRRWGMPKLVTK